MLAFPRGLFKAYSAFKTGCLLFLSAACLFFLSSCKAVEKVDRTDFMMDTFVTQHWEGKNSQACYEEIKAMLEQGENMLSAYKEGSEILMLSQSSEKNPVKLSPQVFSILEKSKELSLKTGGKFDITIAPLVKLWDVTGKSPTIPKKEEIEKACSLICFDWLVLDKESSTAFFKKEGMGVDLGAVLKGFFAEKSLAAAKRHGVSGYISIGGNMAVAGKKEDGSDFIMGIRNPRGEANDYIGTVDISGLTMATAGDYERSFQYEGRLYHHILDPFTGFPAQTDLICATVISSDGLLADFLSTYIFMEGSEGLDKFKNLENAEFMAVDKDLNVYFSKGFKERFHPNSNKKEFNFKA